MTVRIIMPQTLAPPSRPGSLLKRPREQRTQRKQFRVGGRETDSSYLALIGQLPCLNCGLELDPPRRNDAAHVRYNSAAFGKRQAIGAKPDDQWTLPLCRDCHDRQHKIGEHQFWHEVGLNPLLVCEDLQKAAPDIVRMRAVVFTWIAVREPGL